MKAATEYRYVIEVNRVSRDATAEEAEAVRASEYQGADDLPEGTEFASGTDGQKVYRIAI